MKWQLIDNLTFLSAPKVPCFTDESEKLYNAPILVTDGLSVFSVVYLDEFPDNPWRYAGYAAQGQFYYSIIPVYEKLLYWMPIQMLPSLGSRLKSWWFFPDPSIPWHTPILVAREATDNAPAMTAVAARTNYHQYEDLFYLEYGPRGMWSPTGCFVLGGQPMTHYMYLPKPPTMFAKDDV
jgi:hypothetical protein